MKKVNVLVETFNFLSRFTLSLFDMLWSNKYTQHSSSMEDFSTNIFFSYNLEFFYDSHFQVRAREKEVKKFRCQIIPIDNTLFTLCVTRFFYTKLSFSRDWHFARCIVDENDVSLRQHLFDTDLAN